MHYLVRGDHTIRFSTLCSCGACKSVNNIFTADIRETPFWTCGRATTNGIEMYVGGLFRPHAYTLRHGYKSNEDGIRHWVLEAKRLKDTKKWIILSTHVNDCSIGNAAFDS